MEFDLLHGLRAPGFKKTIGRVNKSQLPLLLADGFIALLIPNLEASFCQLGSNECSSRNLSATYETNQAMQFKFCL